MHIYIYIFLRRIQRKHHFDSQRNSHPSPLGVSLLLPNCEPWQSTFGDQHHTRKWKTESSQTPWVKGPKL